MANPGAGGGPPRDAGRELRRGFRSLSISLAVYTAGAVAAAISAELAYMETTLLSPALIEPALQDAALASLIVAFGLDFTSLLMFLAGSADLLRNRGHVSQRAGAALKTHRIAAFAGFGLLIPAVAIFALSTAVSCINCATPATDSVVVTAALLLGLIAVLIIAAVLRTAVAFAPARVRPVAVIGALLGFVAAIGGIASVFLFIRGTWLALGWIAFGGFPLVNWSPIWGPIAAVGSGLMAWAYRRIARLPEEGFVAPGAGTARPTGQ